VARLWSLIHFVRYNTLFSPRIHSREPRPRECLNTNRIFKLNQGLAIIEPFYKMAEGDGIPVVRIDRPAEVVEWKPPSTTQEWTILGSSFLHGEHADTALRCYEESRNAPDIASIKKELWTAAWSPGASLPTALRLSLTSSSMPSRCKHYLITSTRLRVLPTI
jgi:hypothetical protein